MKKIAITLYTLTLFLGISLTAKAQYTAALGARFGSPNSVSFKYFPEKHLAFEAYLGTRAYTNYRWNTISAAAQIHRPIDFMRSIRELNYYVGAGASAFFWTSGDLFTNGGIGRPSMGLQAYAGLDYSFDHFPLNLSIDWIPTYFIGNGNVQGFHVDYGSFGARFILGR